MATQSLAKLADKMPSAFDDFFKPWNEWFDGGSWSRTLKVPAVNITEHQGEYIVSLAAPGLKKEDFKIDVDGNMLTISSEKENRQEQKEGEKYSRREFSYQSFQRIFELPVHVVDAEHIQAKYENGLLHLVIPKKEEAKQRPPRTIQIS